MAGLPRADPDKLDRANLDKANKVSPDSRSNSASKGPVDRRRSSKANKAEPGRARASLDKAPRVSPAGQGGQAVQVDRASKNNSASRPPVASRSSAAQPARDNKTCPDSKAFRSKVAREACPVRLVSRSNSAAGKVP